jgi:hypothetical protein
MAVSFGFERANHKSVLSVHFLCALTLALGAVACSDDPVYLQSVPPALEFAPNNDPDAMPPAPLDVTVPMALPTPDDDAERMSIATKLGLQPDQVPTLRRDDTDLELEWQLENAGTKDVVASLAVNGANEFYRYDPSMIMVGEEQDAPPPLMGGRPIMIPAGGSTTGVFREDDLREAAQDLDAMSRAGYNYTKALITRWSTPDISGGMGGMLDVISSEAIPLLLDLQVMVNSNSPLRLTVTLRVRDRTGRLRPNETDATKLVPASTNVFQPPVMMMMP